MQTIAVTPQWQIYIPEEIRQVMRWEKPIKAKLEIKGENLIITPQKSALFGYVGRFASQFKSKKIDFVKTRDLIDYSQL